MATATPPTTMNRTPLSASSANSFSNEASIVAGRIPSARSQDPRVSPQHLQTTQNIQTRQGAADFLPDGFPKSVLHVFDVNRQGPSEQGDLRTRFKGVRPRL